MYSPPTKLCHCANTKSAVGIRVNCKTLLWRKDRGFCMFLFLIESLSVVVAVITIIWIAINEIELTLTCLTVYCQKSEFAEGLHI